MAEPTETQATETKDTGPQPQFDPAAIQSAVQSSIQQYFADNPIQVPRAEEARPVPQVNPIADLINPYIEPKLRQAALDSNAAVDTALFYATHPECIKHKDELEKVFSGLKSQGTPFDHEAVWAWYRGRNFDTFYKEAVEQDQARLKQAQLDSTVDGGSRPRNIEIKDAHEASDEDLEKGLKDISF